MIFKSQRLGLSRTIVILISASFILRCSSIRIPSYRREDDCRELKIEIVNGIPGISLGNKNVGQKFYYVTDNIDADLVAGTVTPGFGIQMSAPRPIQWNYMGPGNVEELTLKENNATAEEPGCHKILLKPFSPTAALISPDTGNYVVSYISEPRQQKSLYLYIPNKYPPFLLNTGRLQTMTWTEGKPLVLPCLLNDPSVKVMFAKRSGLNEWKEVHGVGSYNSQKGFTIKKPFGEFKTLYGSYKCFTKLRNRNDTVFISVAPSEYFLD